MKAFACIFVFVLLGAGLAFGQQNSRSLDRVLQNLQDKRGHDAIAADKGSAGLWERLLKLNTTGSVMHTTAHPDDEHAGLLTYLGRGEGYRTALFTINRGEAGANAIGPELFDALGMIRTEELRQSAKYYGLDDQYFTSFTDYGFSKTLEEALRNWGRENVLREMVRVIRMNRPLVVIARFHGSERDGHGHHQAAGGITPEAVAAAADPNRFTEDMVAEGTRPWRVLKLYRGGIRDQENWHVEVDPGEFSDRLGISYQNLGYYGLSLQRSQTSGRYRESLGSAAYKYERMDERAGTGEEASFFDGIDTSISGLFALFNESHGSNEEERLVMIEEQVEQAMNRFDITNSVSVVPPLVEGLRLTRELLETIDAGAESAFVLRIKEHQFEDAIHTALGLQLQAIGMPADTPDSQSPWAPLPTLGVVVPGQEIKVTVDLLNPSTEIIDVKDLALESEAGLQADGSLMNKSLAMGEKVTQDFKVTVPADAKLSGRYFSRASIMENRYEVHDRNVQHTPRGLPAQEAVLKYEVHGVGLELRESVYTRRANLPKGYVLDVLKVAPRAAVIASPSTRVVPLVRQPAEFEVDIEVLNNDPAGLSGSLTLEAPEGWKITPASIPVTLAQAGQQQRFSFEVSAQGMGTETYMLRAVLEADGQTFDQGYELVDQEGLERHYLYRPAQVAVHGVSVNMAEGQNIGYVMGVGDEVPAAISQLGASVTLFTEDDLESRDFGGFDAIVIGTRAYAVRQDLLRFNNRLMEYAKAGGHLIVLYQTPEYVPNQMAPFPADLPRSAEEISEEDAPVAILEPEHPVFQSPNKITSADFDGWVEQRGSKFFASWDDAYVPLVVSNDTGQAPQRGGWLMANLGEGTFTYFAYAIHRQAPFAVPGALRIFANVLSFGNAE